MSFGLFQTCLDTLWQSLLNKAIAQLNNLGFVHFAFQKMHRSRGVAVAYEKMEQEGSLNSLRAPNRANNAKESRGRGLLASEQNEETKSQQHTLHSVLQMGLPYEIENFWPRRLPVFHSIFHGNNNGIGFVISSMLGALFSRTCNTSKEDEVPVHNMYYVCIILSHILIISYCSTINHDLEKCLSQFMVSQIIASRSVFWIQMRKISNKTIQTVFETKVYYSLWCSVIPNVICI